MGETEFRGQGPSLREEDRHSRDGLPEAHSEGVTPARVRAEKSGVYAGGRTQVNPGVPRGGGVFKSSFTSSDTASEGVSQSMGAQVCTAGELRKSSLLI